MTVNSPAAIGSVSTLLGSGDTLSQRASQSALLERTGTALSANADRQTEISNASSLLSNEAVSFLPASISAFSASYALPQDVIGASAALRVYQGTQHLTDSIVSMLV